ncbi:SDR family oxidoreductase [Puniceibacterium sp. IMCC21224]|uniref:SDR family oxidoreductase n=1 Tax=Puniceibacterium sp. IMCC21224 TaxID=1618204 RepID=UPI00065D67ED|nr:SDR family oxidoreductase [Puniceibacterium sp. IMCC21224]KMK65621.1 dehydrogenase of unknown specificity, short-chain alcohol dehydrogenase like [Puniceibacterium sp. IMCC21224]
METKKTTTPGILITGGAKRIGAEMARRFVREGFRVMVHYQSSQSEAEALRDELNAGGEVCRLVQGDLSRRADVSAVFAAAQDWLGRIDLCLNNASMFRGDDIFGVEEAQFDAHLAVNLKAPVYLAELTATQDMAVGDCLILNMLDNKVFAINPDFFTYTLSKAALLTATEMLAMRFDGAPRVCGIAPSITLISGKQNQANFEKSARVNPLGRRVFPSDLADAAVYLWNAKSSNGQVITIDGGQSLLKLDRDVAYLVKEGLLDG